ncbi:MAG: protein-tyrosine phosphatase [Planctomycetota bacterium]|nr:protein-tyrosine phosphatase [Planctomycetota bacterium]
MIDIHTHVLPMIDDGPTTVQESLEMCRIAGNDGIKKIIATPHIQNGINDEYESNVLKKISMMNQLLKQEGVDIELFPGAEVYLNERLLNEEILKQSKLLTLNGGKKYLLLEFSFQWIPPETEKVIFELKTMGLTPILPHLERNITIQSNPGMLVRFVEMGAILQVTAQSIAGDFGTASRKCALWMLKKNLVHIIASDAHSPSRRPPLLSRAVRIVSDLLGKEVAGKMVSEHPKMILEGTPFIM